FPPTNNQLRASSNPRSQATVQAGQIVTETVQRSDQGNVGKQGKRENQVNGSKVVCYNCRGEGHVARQCKEPKWARNSQWYADKELLLNAQEKGEVLDAEAEAFLADVECTAPYEGQLAMTTTNMFQANHEDAYDFDVDDRPDASIAFMANFSSAGSLYSSNNISINEVQTNDADDIFGVVSYPLSQELHQEEGIESDNESLPEENTIPYSKHMASNDEHPSGSYLHIHASTFLDLNAQITSLYKVNDERNQTLEKSIEAKYVDEIILLTNANKVAAGLLQKFQMPTQTIPMLSKTSKIAYQDLHKTGLGSANPWYGKKARLSQPSLYCGEEILKPV
nr:hypothetical protein [Tanacetum cinerariifolium]